MSGDDAEADIFAEALSGATTGSEAQDDGQQGQEPSGDQGQTDGQQQQQQPDQGGGGEQGGDQHHQQQASQGSDAQGGQQQAQQPVVDPAGRLRDPVTKRFVAQGQTQDGQQAQQGGQQQQPEPQGQAQQGQTDPNAQGQQQGGEGDPQVPAQVPSWRLAEELNRRREAETENAQLRDTVRNLQIQMQVMQRGGVPQQPGMPQHGQPQQQPQLDPWGDPDGFSRQVQGQVQGVKAELRLENSLARANDRHGGEKFQAAFAAFHDATQAGDRASYMRVMNSPDPGEAMVAWHQERQTMTEIGEGGIEAFKQKIRDELIKDPEVHKAILEAAAPRQRSER